MFRELRRKNQLLSQEESLQVLRRGSSGVLALSGDDGYPYAVPLSYLYHDNRIFFHCAKAGHKLDALTGNEKVSFCVIDQDRVVQEEYTSHFRSVIVFGRARVLEDDGEKRRAIALLTEKYAPDQEEHHRQQAIEREYGILCMVELSIEHMSGKVARELVTAR